MKKILIALIFFPMMAFGQNQPFKDCNVLVVKSELPDLYQEVSRRLIAEGWIIKDSNAKLQTFVTDWKEIKYLNQRLIISIEDDRISIRSRMQNVGANAVLNADGYDYDLEWKKSGVLNDAWVRMEVFASHFGTEKSYFKK